MSLRLTRSELRVIENRIHDMLQDADQPSESAQMVLNSIKEVAREDSPSEAILAFQIRALGLRQPKRNYRFVVGRKLELDFAWPVYSTLRGREHEILPLDGGFAVEVQGGVHLIRKQAAKDTQKIYYALMNKWRVLPVTSDDVKSGRAIAWITDILGP